MDDLISRQAAIDAINKAFERVFAWDGTSPLGDKVLENVPSAQPEPCEDAVSRKAVYDAMVEKGQRSRRYKLGEIWELNGTEIREALDTVPSAQPERTCVNCGRTANNGGWYADGRTRCPIEEHYALPKDGYCHLWEKRKDWEDDYVKRAEEGEK